MLCVSSRIGTRRMADEVFGRHRIQFPWKWGRGMISTKLDVIGKCRMNSGIGPEGYFEKFYLSRDWRFYKGVLSRIVAMSEPGPILDLGAGCGYLVEASHRWGWECVGLEGSENAVKIARHRCPEIDIRQFLLSEPLPFERDYFSTVVMNQVIEHLEPSVANNCIAEAFRVLRPGGALIIFSPSRFFKSA